ncbi:MAG TPA: RDD family protein [Vicinamibacterales bacterium]|nr:RDD family protein [Vicinamibacterales bacterium]
MKCPKCQYISFDSGDRCRNCGYDFSLSIDLPRNDLPIQNGTEPLGPMADFALQEMPASTTRRASFDSLDPVLSGAPAPGRAAASTATVPGTSDLPLFTGASEAPLVSADAAPRAPLAVRRATPSIPRVRARRESDEPRLDLEVVEHTVRRSIPIPAADESAALPHPAAGAAARVLAAAIDLALTAGIDAAVLYFTLRLCDLSWRQVAALPAVPLVAFLVLLNGGYFVTFIAASGQTIGKMAAGIRVVAAESDDPEPARVPVEQAVLRAAAYTVSVLPAGLGFLAALAGRDRRALHDRLSGTRVVKA